MIYKGLNEPFMMGTSKPESKNQKRFVFFLPLTNKYNCRTTPNIAVVNSNQLTKQLASSEIAMKTDNLVAMVLRSLFSNSTSVGCKIVL